jgi:hypothetical protein
MAEAVDQIFTVRENRIATIRRYIPSQSMGKWQDDHMDMSEHDTATRSGQRAPSSGKAHRSPRFLPATPKGSVAIEFSRARAAVLAC